jgi:hypothetical protein
MSRQKRLLRTAILGVVLIAVIAAIVNLVGGGGSSPEKLSKVAFHGKAAGQSDAKRKAAPADVQSESAAITKMLNDWYQAAYVDPSKWSDAAFPDIAKLFAPGAQTSFRKDVTSMTIGDLRDLAARVVPHTQKADVTVFFATGTKPRYAVADVTFTAVATMKQKGARQVVIKQHGVYHLEKDGSDWVVAYYDVNQNENSVEPTPAGSAT